MLFAIHITKICSFQCVIIVNMVDLFCVLRNQLFRQNSKIFFVAVQRSDRHTDRIFIFKIPGVIQYRSNTYNITDLQYFLGGNFEGHRCCHKIS